MQEFSSISVSSYEPGSLVGALNEQAAAGWGVISIVPTGSSITAYLVREASESSSDEPVVAEIAEPVAEPVADDSGVDAGDVAAAAVVADAVDPIDEPAGWAATDTTTEVAADPVAEPAVTEPAVAEPAATESAAVAAAAGAAPAGWYADPSSRYELRYWDGSQWTEHVSRSGQQFTDPPVA